MACDNGGCTGGCWTKCYGCQGTNMQECLDNCKSSCNICAGSCGNGCKGGCLNGCSGGCQGGCLGGCSGSCYSWCMDGCEGSCGDGCSDGCARGCSDGCTYSCGTECSRTCSTECTGTCSTACNGCGGVCTGRCTLTCTNDCDKGCRTLTHTPAFEVLSRLSTLQTLIRSSDVINLRELIKEEAARWGVTNTPTNMEDVGQLIKTDTTMKNMKTTLSALGKTVTQPTAGTKTLGTEIQAYINAAIDKYGQINPRD